MIRLTQPEPRLFGWKDPFYNTKNEKRLAGLEKGWPNAFKEGVLPHLAIKPLMPYFCKNNGRPTKDLKTMLGLLVLQDMCNLTDSDTLLRLQYDISFRWALDIQDANDDTLYICPKTYYNFRRTIVTNDLADIIFNDTTCNLIDEFKVDYRLQRMDSMHFNTNMKRLTRLGVMSATVEKFLKTLRKEDSQAFNAIDFTLTDRYLGKDVQGHNPFGHVMPSENAKAMLTVAKDIFGLINAFQANPVVSGMPSFALLNRVFQDQCRVSYQEKIQVDAEIVLKGDDEAKFSDETSIEETDSEDVPEGVVENSNIIAEPKVELLPAKEISSGSLQNPTDPDATYSGHKGQGFHVQLVETYTEADTESEGPMLNLITLVDVRPANEHDSAALVPAVDDLEKRGVKPEVLTADTAYGGDANSEYAASKGIELLSPVPGNTTNRSNGKGTGKLTSDEKMSDAAQTLSFASENAAWPEIYVNDPDDTTPVAFRLADFQSDNHGVIEGCPMGQKAETQRNPDNTGGRAYFDRNVCLRCPMCGLCPVLVSKNKAWLTYQDEQVRLDKRRTFQDSGEFRKRYRMRSGIEGTNSQLARKGAKRLRIRGMMASKLKMNFKALGLNAMRVIKYLSQKPKEIVYN
ncbi:MAG: transposase [Deltaproteobacteria bacterium]|nr:transposase [Deltaproteobacteria bacterium]